MLVKGATDNKKSQSISSCSIPNIAISTPEGLSLWGIYKISSILETAFSNLFALMEKFYIQNEKFAEICSLRAYP